jgi:hypothetical protein
MGRQQEAPGSALGLPPCSAARVRGKTEDLRKVGAHLNVNLLLEGTARHEDEDEPG